MTDAQVPDDAIAYTSTQSRHNWWKVLVYILKCICLNTEKYLSAASPMMLSRPRALKAATIGGKWEFWLDTLSCGAIIAIIAIIAICQHPYQVKKYYVNLKRETDPFKEQASFMSILQLVSNLTSR